MKRDDEDESLHLQSLLFDGRYFYSDWTHFINHNRTISLPFARGQFARISTECAHWDRSQVARHTHTQTPQKR